MCVRERKDGRGKVKMAITVEPITCTLCNFKLIKV